MNITPFNTVVVLFLLLGSIFEILVISFWSEIDMHAIAHDIKTYMPLLTPLLAPFVSILLYKLQKQSLRMNALSALNALRNPIRAWADECVSVIDRAAQLSYLDPEKMPPETFFMSRSDILRDLATQIDRGRFLQQNTPVKGLGSEKPEAYQGLAPKTINRLKEIKDEVVKYNYNVVTGSAAINKKIIDLKREFVSDVQSSLKPRKFEELTKASVESAGLL